MAYIKAGWGVNVGQDFTRLQVDTPIELAPKEYAGNSSNIVGYIAGDPAARLGFMRHPRIRVVATRQSIVE